MTNVSKSLSQKMASIMMLDESVIEAKLNAMLCLGLDDMVQWMTMLTNKYEDINKRYESLSQKIMDTRNMNPEKLIQTNFEDNHGVVISGGNNSISIKISKDGVEMEKRPAPKSAVDILDKAVMEKIDSNDLEKALVATASMAREGFFKPQKLYIGAFQIIKEGIAPEMDTASFCRMMAKKTDLSEVLLPKNDNIRKIYFKSNCKYPNWRIEGESVESTQDIIDIAKELLRRL